MKKNVLYTIIAVVVVVIVVIIAAIAITALNSSSTSSTSPSPTPPQVTVTAVDLSIQYNGISSGYIGPTSNSLGGFITNAGTQYVYSITFTSSATLLSHNINQVYVNSPGFSVASISPTLPYGFSPGSTFTISITIDVPSSAYNGVLNIIVATS